METLQRNPYAGETDFHWFIVRTQARQEERCVAMLTEAQGRGKNILEVYCPVNTTVRVRRRGKDINAPVYTSHVFVYATLKALTETIRQKYPEGFILYGRKKHVEGGDAEVPIVVPVQQMNRFREFLDSYHDEMILLDRPYSDYEFNHKKGEYNEVVKIVAGPFVGRTGFVARFDGDKRLVFNLFDYEQDAIVPITISIPNLWAFQLVRLTNSKDRKVGNATARDRAIDRMFGTIQACGYKDRSLSILDDAVQMLCNDTTWTGLCRFLSAQHMERLGHAFASYASEDVTLIFSLIRYERTNKDYVHCRWQRNFLRPFLTPSSGLEGVPPEPASVPVDKSSRLAYYASLARKKTPTDLTAHTEGLASTAGDSVSSVDDNILSVGDKTISHEHFTEIIREIEIGETFFDPDTRQETSTKSRYFAHVGMMTDAQGAVTFFVNWDKFLMEYFMTGDEANRQLIGGRTRSVRDRKNRLYGEKLIASFRNYAPTLYAILCSPSSPVRAADSLLVGDRPLNAFVTTVQVGADARLALDTLITTCVRVCEEINSSAHLAIWREYLRTVWLHR